MKKKADQNGTYTVEFAIVGSLFFLIFFSILEIARLMFTWNVLTEVSRRSARLATVCNILTTPSSPTTSSISESSIVVDLASFGENGILPNFSANNIDISYLKLDGSQATRLYEVQLVRAEIINYQHDLLIPGLFLTLNSPSFRTTLVSESLGAVPGDQYRDCSRPI